MSAEHRIIGVAAVSAPDCARCSGATPHNIVVRCVCGNSATGKKEHIWTLTRDGEFATLQPSFNWLNDPMDESKGSHLHEFVTSVPLQKLSVLFADVLAPAEGGAL